MNITEQDLRVAVNKSKTFQELSLLLFGYSNGKTKKKIVSGIDAYKIDVSHFDSHHKARAARKYPNVTKTCPVCSETFETQLGHPKETVTCGYSCSNTHFYDLRFNDVSSEKRRQAVLTNPNIRIRIVKETVCEWCSEKFHSKFGKRFCNNKCASTFRMAQPEVKEKYRSIQKALVAAGTHKGWMSRGKMKQSWPEVISEQCLNELGFVRGIEYKIELRMGKWFVDFAFVDRKIAIEIDGRQHTYPERAAKDKEKDSFLSSEGWAVHRISWKRLTKETRAELKQKLTDILIV